MVRLMRIYSMWVMFALVGCVATVDRDQGNVKTIGYYTGSLSKDEGVYLKEFERGAEKACGGSYEILEKSRNPSTLSGMDLPTSKFYWVIKCKAGA